MKYIKIILLSLMFASIANADKISGFMIGMAGVNNKHINESNSLYMGVDGLVNTSISGLYVGVGADYVGIDLPYSSNPNYTLGVQAKIGYSLKNNTGIPLCIKADVGYGVSRLYDENSYGSQHSLAAEVSIYNGIGVGVKYKYVDTGSDLFFIKNYKSNMLYVKFGF